MRSINTNQRKSLYVDVSKMSEQELCETLGIKYVPWYKSSLFWAMALTFSMPSIAILINTFQG